MPTAKTESIKIGKPILVKVKRLAHQERRSYRLMLEILVEMGLAIRTATTEAAVAKEAHH